MLTYTFYVGVFPPRRTVKIKAADLHSAFNKTSEKLDRQATRKGDEPPVAWDLALKHVDVKV